MKILFDTNVLISGFISKGYSHEVIEDAQYKHELYYTDFIVTEMKAVLKDKFPFHSSFIQPITSFIKRYFKYGKTALLLEDICRDKDDNQILADTVENNIDYLITGDRDLLALKRHHKVRIITPREYWSI